MSKAVWGFGGNANQITMGQPVVTEPATKLPAKPKPKPQGEKK